MTNDLAAREQALDATASFIVQAPAGSGKTELLIQRYLKLLSVATVPEAVVAITFTKKASAEIRSRVIRSLRAAAKNETPQAAHERITAKLAHKVLIRDGERGWGLLQNPARLRVDTIDALCASIARQMPWLARFGAMPEITEKAGDVYREAARNTLAMYADGGEDAEAIGALLLHLDNDFGMAERLLAQMIEKRDQWLRHTGVKPNMEKVRRQIERTLERLIEESLTRVHAAFSEPIAKRVVDLAKHARRSTGSLPGTAVDDLAQWQTLADFLVTSTKGWRVTVNINQGFPPRDRRKRECEDLLKDLQGEVPLLEALKEVRSLPPAQFDESQWKAMVAVIAVLPLAVAQLETTFRERGRVDFAQLSIAAARALGRVDAPSDLALALGERIEHILVDEFQDTSQTQYSLLERLTSGWSPGDGQTLFLVGDPMQSIYRFRQAEVGLFLKARQEGIGAIRFKALTLRTNFRSQPGIVRWVNETFGAILPQQEDIRAGAVTYSPSEAAGDREEAPMPIIVPFFGDSAKAEAKRVATLVKESCDGSTAILVRARSHLTHIVAELKQRGIRFQAIEIDELRQRPVIQDLLALTFALLHLADRTSWLAVLRAPWCGLTLVDLHVLAKGGDSIWTALQRHDLVLSEDGKLRLARVVPVIAQALAQRGRQTLRMWVEDTWLRLGGSSCLREEADAEDAMAYFDVLAGLEEGSDLTDFEALRVQVRELFAQPDAKATESLQVMTIHKAKGLEFDTVIVPGLGRGAKPDDAQLLLWQEVSEDELLLAPISAGGKDKDPIYRYLQRIEKEKTEHEGVRLLYVAATRARSRLYLLGHVEETTQKSGARAMAGPYKGSFLKSLWDREGPTFAAAYAARVVQGVATTEEPAVRKLRRVPADWKAPGPNPVLTWTGPLDDPSEVERVSFDWAGDTLRHIGTAVHAYLQRIAREGLDRWHEEAVRAQRGGYRALLANLGVPPDTLETAVMRTETALLRCLADPRARWIIEPHQSAASESELTGVVDGRVYQVVIDRTFIDNDGTRWVIDYKTSVHEGGGIEKFLDNERARYKATLDRYARLMQQLEQRPVKLGLYFPLLNGWREWEASPLVMRQASLFGD